MKKETIARMQTVHVKLDVFIGERCVVVLSTFDRPYICTRDAWDNAKGDLYDRARTCRKTAVPYQYVPPWMWTRLMTNGLFDRNTVATPYPLVEAVEQPDFDESHVIYWDSAHDLVFPIGSDIPMSLPVIVQITERDFDIDKARTALLRSEWVLDCPVPIVHASTKLLSFTCRLPDTLYRSIITTLKIVEPAQWRTILRDMYVWHPSLERFSQSHQMDFFGLKGCHRV